MYVILSIETKQNGETMINFIICEDEPKIRKSVRETIIKTMMQNEEEYNITEFETYTKEFINLANNKNENKIYILDIETPTYSGIDIARLIRKHDYTSPIIFLTAHEDLGYVVLKSEIMTLSFISKFDNYKTKLKKSIVKAVSILSSKKHYTFIYKSVKYNILLTSILYVYYDNFLRKVKIVTDQNEYHLNQSLKQIMLELTHSFKQSSRNCIINMNRVKEINFKDMLITFDNNKTIKHISQSMKSELLDD